MGSAGKAEVWALIWREVQATGQVPPIEWSVRELDANRSLVARQYRILVEDGMMDRPHGRGSYRLLRTPDGRDVTVLFETADSPTT